MAWIGGRPTPGALAVAHALNPEMAILSRHDTSITGRAERGVSAEISDDDQRGIDFVSDLIGRLAAGRLTQPTPAELAAMRLYEFAGDINATNKVRLKTRYRTMEPFDENVLGRPAYMLAWNDEQQGGEVVVEAPAGALILSGAYSTEKVL